MKIDFQALATSTIIMLLCLLIILMYPQSNFKYVTEDSIVAKYLYNFDTFKTKCGSDSMGRVIDCVDTLYQRRIRNGTKLYEGRIYVYEKNETRNVIHRLVKCLDTDCNRSIFIGDNNYIADKIVNRSQIIGYVYQIRFG